jgi:hypothetical protein
MTIYVRKNPAPRVCFKCDYCGDVVIERIAKFSIRKRFNCPKVGCVHHAKGHVGESNGMFGKTHTDAVKSILADTAKNTFLGKSYDDIYGKEKSDNLKSLRAEQMSLNRKGLPSWNSGKTGVYSEETLERIGKGSSEKFTEEYLIKQRETMEERGLWIPLDLKSDYAIYAKLSNWIDSMWPDIDGGVEKLRSIGIFHYKNNPNGVVRDHKVSRRDGLYHGVFPEIIRHPCNCQILTNSENTSKGSKSSISIEELFFLIESYDKDWVEQSVALDKISEYRIGKRYDIRKEGLL